MNNYNESIQPKLNAKSAKQINLKGIDQEYIIDLESEDVEFREEFTRVIDENDIPEADELNMNNINKFNGYLGAEIGIKRNGGEDIEYGRIIKRTVDEEGMPIGCRHDSGNVLLDNRKYDIEYLDGRIESITANILAENVISQVNEDGHRQLVLDEIIDHRKTPEAVPKSEGTYNIPGGIKKKVITTKGWEFYVQWRDGHCTWVKLKDLKQSYPIKILEYVKSIKIEEEPAFAWWISYVEKKKEQIMNKVRSKYWERTHKYGIKIPKTMKEAELIDIENNNRLWRDAIAEEMKNVRTSFESYDGDPRELRELGYKEIRGHLVFDVKLGENFRRKARYVAEGFRVSTPSSITYSSVVKRDSIRILLILYANRKSHLYICTISIPISVPSSRDPYEKNKANPTTLTMTKNSKTKPNTQMQTTQHTTPTTLKNKQIPTAISPTFFPPETIEKTKKNTSNNPTLPNSNKKTTQNTPKKTIKTGPDLSELEFDSKKFRPHLMTKTEYGISNGYPSTQHIYGLRVLNATARTKIFNPFIMKPTFMDYGTAA